MSLFAEILGWVAMSCILLAFYLLCNEKVTAKSKLYQFLNITGSGIFVYTLSMAKAWPAVALNAIYALIALSALFKIYKAEKS